MCDIFFIFISQLYKSTVFHITHCDVWYLLPTAVDISVFSKSRMTRALLFEISTGEIDLNALVHNETSRKAKCIDLLKI